LLANLTNASPFEVSWMRQSLGDVLHAATMIVPEVALRGRAVAEPAALGKVAPFIPSSSLSVPTAFSTPA
jgi:hypothetical protein